MSTWYYRKDKAEIGPISSQELKQLAAVREVSPTTLVCSEADAEWVPAGQIPDLFGPKYCHVCGQECSGQSGMKYRQDHYYCRECFKRMRGQHPDARVTSRTTRRGDSLPQTATGVNGSPMPLPDDDAQSTRPDEMVQCGPDIREGTEGQESSATRPPAGSLGTAGDRSAIIWDCEKAAEKEEDPAAIAPGQKPDKLTAWICIGFGSIFLVFNFYFAVTVRPPTGSVLLYTPLLPLAVVVVFGGLILGGILILKQKYHSIQPVIRVPLAFWAILTMMDLRNLLNLPWDLENPAHTTGIWLGFLASRGLQAALFVILEKYVKLSERHIKKWVVGLVVGLPLAAALLGVLFLATCRRPG